MPLPTGNMSSDPILQILAGLAQAESARKADVSGQYQSALGGLEGMLGAIDSAPGPEQVPVPQGVNPLGGMAAVFASSLAEQMGARGATQNVQRQMEQMEIDRRAALQQNLESTAADRREKQLQRLQTQMKIADMKMKQAEEMGDIEEYYTNLRTTIATNKAMEKIKADNDLDLQRLRGRQNLAEIGAREASQAKAEAPEKTRAAEERELRMFTESVAGKQKLPGSTETKKEGPLWSRKEVTQLSPKGKMDIQNKAYATATATSFSSVRKAAVMAYYDTFRAADGSIPDEVKQSPAWQRFLTLTDQLPPEEAVAIYNEIQGAVGSQ